MKPSPLPTTEILSRLAACVSIGLAIAFGHMPGISGVANAVVIGDTAPDFTLSTVDGAAHTLSNYRGQVVLVGLIGWG